MSASAIMEAKDWLLSHGYEQFEDGTWNFQGEEVDILNVLAEFIDELNDEAKG